MNTFTRLFLILLMGLFLSGCTSNQNINQLKEVQTEVVSQYADTSGRDQLVSEIEKLIVSIQKRCNSISIECTSLDLKCDYFNSELILNLNQNCDAFKDSCKKIGVVKKDFSTSSLADLEKLKESSIQMDSTLTTLDNSAKEIVDYCVKNTPKNYGVNIDEVKNKAITLSYDDLFRNNEDYIGKIIYIKGEIVQVLDEGNNFYKLRINTKYDSYLGYYEDTIYIHYKGDRLLEKDIVEIYGEVKGLFTYQAVLGNPVTIPELYSLNLNILQKRGG